jgi:tetratricopeptide (TPR) repeat protein
MIASLSQSFSARVFVAILVCWLCSSPLSAQESKTTTEPKSASTDESAEVADSADDAEGNAGEGDLDEAVIKRIDAESVDQLESVAALLKSSLRKGLDEENESFAKKMLASVLLQRSQALAGAMLQARGRRALQLRDEILDGLDEAVKYDAMLVEAHLMIARLNLLPGGDKQATVEATTEAIKLLKDDPLELSAALVLRALTQDDHEKKLADLNAAIDADPNNLAAFQERAAVRLQQDDVEGAIEDLQIVLLEQPTNAEVAATVVTKLAELDRIPEAVDLITKTLASKPSEGLYRLRADLYRMEKKYDDAMSDLNKAFAMQPKDYRTLLQRAGLALEREDVKTAKRDFRSALQIQPGIVNLDLAIALRAQIAMQENRLADAINDLKLLVERNPQDVFRRMQLSNLYIVDNRPRKAIEVISEILDTDPKNMIALRSRADTLLSVGDHQAAIEDYQSAIEAIGNLELTEADDRQKSEAAAVYNNLSWVLSTSPNDSVRDGKRAVEFGQKAAELSDFKEAHILSTLAAGYAELGKFEKAVEWSTKAVELGREADPQHNQLDQLELELENYQDGKPWREKQETEENPVPLLSPEDLIDT